MDSAISIRELKVSYGSYTILDHLSLDIAPGEFLVLLGPSGCGKSTLLNALAGFNEAAGGEIWISGRNVTWEEPKDRGIGMVFQSYALYPHMSVRKNLSFGLRVAGIPKAEIERRVAKTAALLHLEPLLERRPAQLSGGQRQRVAIGRALTREVEVFLFDEPLSNLDAKLRNELRVEIKKLHQQLCNTMIYVTHDQVEALTLADRIAIMKDGVIQQLDAPADIYHRPANLFVAGFIGAPAMNFIAGRLRLDAATPCFEAGSMKMDLRGYGFTQTPAEGPVTLGFRPEHLTFGAAPQGSHALSATVSVVEPMGAETIVWFEHEGATHSLRAMEELAFRPGEPISPVIDIPRASLFAENGNRL